MLHFLVFKPYLYNHQVLLTDFVLAWNLFAAAMTTNEDLRSQLILKIYNWASYNTTGNGFAGDVFPVIYYNDFGSAIGGLARSANWESVSGVVTEVVILVISPAQGAMFAPLALKLVQRSLQFFMTDNDPLVELLYYSTYRQRRRRRRRRHKQNRTSPQLQGAS